MAKNSKTEDGHFKEHTKVYDIILNACKNWEEKLGKDIDWTKVFAGIKKKGEIKLVSNEELLYNSCDKLNSEGHGRCKFCLTEKDNFSLSVPV